MLLTGKYLPDEDIVSNNNSLLSFSHYNEYENKTYYEDSNGTWVKYDYNDRGNLIHREVSNGYVSTILKGKKHIMKTQGDIGRKKNTTLKNK